MSQKKKKKKTKAKPKPANKTLIPNIGKAPVLSMPAKSRGRTYAEIAAWSVLVFLLYFTYRIIVLYGADFSEFFGRFSETAPYHALDYSMGFLPRALSGQILSFFAEPPFTKAALTAYLVTVYVIAYGLFSVIIGTMIEKALRAKNYLMALFPLLLIFAPTSSWYRSFWIILFDAFLLLFALLALLAIKNEKLMWLVPITLFLGTATNYAHMLFFFPLIFALMYYEYIKSGRRPVRLVHLIVTTISSAAMELYMVWAPFHSDQLSNYSYTDAILYIEEKAGRILEPYERWYISVSVFGKDAAGVPISPGMHYSWLHDWWLQPRFFLAALLICAPIVFFSLLVWRKLAKGETGFLKKSPYFLFMLAPLIVFFEFLFFADLDRLVWGALFTQVLLMAYIFITDGQNKAFTPPAAGKKRWMIYAGFFLAIIVPAIVFMDWFVMTTPANKMSM